MMVYGGGPRRMHLAVLDQLWSLSYFKTNHRMTHVNSVRVMSMQESSAGVQACSNMLNETMVMIAELVCASLCV